ncbi:MAG: TonB-dependent receptor [bacterium TMED46]|nr:MAG: TonB-dependent receptor [bacterium TMED46]|tara:strand:+ start:520 stop:2937 length:2418 start_codon:yes stop_codon:yes gene_type:complete
MFKQLIKYILILQFVFANEFIGKVIDSNTGMPVIEANINLTNVEGVGTTTNENGIFSFNSKIGDQISLEITAIGYASYSNELAINDSELVIIELEQSTLKFSPIDVIADQSRLSGSGQNYYRLPGSISLISKAEVLEFNDTDINRIIGQVPGVYTQEEDGYGLRPNIGMRGTGLERSAKINMMEDGILIAPAPYSSPAAYYSPTAGRMESFEIRKGSSQIKYGPHSTGGAINYVSASIPQHLDFSGGIALGENSTRIAKFKTGISSNNFGLMFQTHLDNTDGFKELDGGGETGYDKKDFLFKGRLNTNSDFAAVEVKISQTEELSHETYLGLTNSDFDKNPYRRYAASKNDLMDANHDQITLTGVIKILQNLDITSTVYNNDFHRNWYKLNEVNGDKIGSILNQDEGTEVSYSLLSATNSDDDIYDIKANNRIYNSKGVQTLLRSNFSLFNTNHNLMIGIRRHSDEMDRYQWSDLYKMNNGNLIMTTAGVRGEGSKNNRLYSAIANSIFYEDEIKFNKLTVIAGARYEEIFLERKDWGNDLDRDSTAASIKSASLNVLIPGLGVSYQLANGIQIFTGIHNGFSPPGPGIDDEDEVLPEESTNFELGSRFNQGFHSAEFVAFYNDYKNLLGEDTEATGSGTYAQFNGGKVLIQGLELSYGNLFSLNGFLLPITFSYTFTDAKFKNNFDSEFDPWGNVSIDDELPYIPRNMFHAQIGLQKGKLRSYLRLKHVDETRTIAGKGELSLLNSTSSFNVIDLVTKYQFNRNISLDMKVNNLTNSKAIVSTRPAGYRPNMPRQFITSLIFDF